MREREKVNSIFFFFSIVITPNKVGEKKHISNDKQMLVTYWTNFIS